VRRRSFLKGAEVVTVVVVGGGVWRAYDQGVFSVGEGPAYEPWTDWLNTAPNALLALLRAAILAASPHNTQPSLFKVTNSSIELHIDTQRDFGALDPYLRSISRIWLQAEKELNDRGCDSPYQPRRLPRLSASAPLRPQALQSGT